MKAILLLAVAAVLPALGGCSTDGRYAEIGNSEQWTKQVMEANQPAMVLYYAAGCSRCMAIYPTLNKVAEKYAGKVKFFKISYNEPATYDIRLNQRIDVYPTVLLYYRGKGLKRWKEEGHLEAYEEVLDSVLKRLKQAGVQ